MRVRSLLRDIAAAMAQRSSTDSAMQRGLQYRRMVGGLLFCRALRIGCGGMCPFWFYGDRRPNRGPLCPQRGKGAPLPR